MDRYRKMYEELSSEIEELNKQHDALHEKIDKNEERQEILSNLIKPFSEIFGPKEEPQHRQEITGGI